MPLYGGARKGAVNAMRIEEISPLTIKTLSNNGLHTLRKRFTELYDSFYHDPNFIEKGNSRLSNLSRRMFIEKYVLLRKEMRRREIHLAFMQPIDLEVNMRLTKAAIIGIDVPALEDVVLEENYVALTGSFLKNPKTSPTLDIVVMKGDRDEALELQVGGALRSVLQKAATFTYCADPATIDKEARLPLFDLVLRARPESSREQMIEPKRLEKKMSMRDKAEYNIESETIRENQKSSAAQRAHKFKAAKWTFSNGHPRCLLCGDEQRTGNICQGFDPETGHSKVETMKAKGETFEVSKPEVTETQVRLPVGNRIEGHRIRTIPISEADGISALEDVDAKEIVTYLFERAKHWTMESAKKWIADHKKKAEGLSFHKERFVKFIKVDMPLHMAGGIIYEPQEVDTQGDWADDEEIGKAMYKFMENYSKQTSRIKVMHEGKSFTFPVIECFQPEEDIKKGGQTVKKGSWWMMIKVTNDAIWNEIADGRLQGFSMGGRAKGNEGPEPKHAAAWLRIVENSDPVGGNV
jgi:hypothetical protein